MLGDDDKSSRTARRAILAHQAAPFSRERAEMMRTLDDNASVLCDLFAGRVVCPGCGGVLRPLGCA